MERDQFDHVTRAFAEPSTRRRLGGLLFALGIGAGAGLNLLGAAETEAKKNKKKKKNRCRKLLQTCNPEGKRKCCKDLTCGNQGSAGFQCCRSLGGQCATNEECCGLYLCGSDGKCFFPDILQLP
jgi:hypothetical protein